MLADCPANQDSDGEESLNPCFTGICSPTTMERSYFEEHNGLNPCFTGICSPTADDQAVTTLSLSLNPCFTGICSPTQTKWISEKQKRVLILVLLEYARRQLSCCIQLVQFYCLNPCFTGICSPTQQGDHTLKIEMSLNPCFTGICSPTQAKQSG